MQVLRRAAVLILLVLSLGISGAHAATVRSKVQPVESKTAPRSAIERIEAWWNLFAVAWNKEGCRIDPWGRCVVNPATQAPTTHAGCGIDPLGLCVISLAKQTSSNTDAGCRIDPLGQCLPGH